MKGKVHDPKTDQDPKGGYEESDEEETSGVDTGEGTPKGKTPMEAKKSLAFDDVDQSDLEKSIAKLEEYAEEGDPVSRKDALLAKAQQGELDEDEREELYKALGGDYETPSSDDEPLSKGIQENETLQKALDVSDYLSEQHTELCKSLDAVGEVINASDKRQHEYNLVLAKAVADTGNLVKSIAEKLDIIGQQPARGPKSAGLRGSQPLAKSFAGQPSGDEMSRDQVLNGLDALMEKSMRDGSNGMTSDGEDILKSISKYEQTHNISRSMLQQVKKAISERAESAH